MTPNKTVLRCLLFLIFAFSFYTSSQSQQAKSQPQETFKRVISYGFVSPNTAEDQTLQQAIKKLNSKEEMRLIKTARLIGCRVRLKPQVTKALGSWSDGAENSTLLRMRADEPTVRYIVSWLGNTAQQKAVFYFRTSSFGGGVLYVLFPARLFRNPSSVSRILDKVGVTYRTLIPLKNRMLVYVVDLNDELREKIPLLALRLRARVKSVRGVGAFIGADTDREKGRRVFLKEIEKYEADHPEAARQCPKNM